ncbi:SDR family oxidoreductase [Xanthomonas maliensis]|nr:SDR family oxidoreductase [Xanthomonas maliensis]
MRCVGRQRCAAGGTAEAVRGGVGNRDNVAELFGRTITAFGRLDAVIHNAGVMPVVPIADGTRAEFERTIATNLRSIFLLMAQAASHLGDDGRFIALSSAC